MASRETPRRTECRDGFLRRRDQCVVAVLALLGLVCVVCWWIWHGGGRGELIEVDRAAPYETDFRVDMNEAAWPEIAQLPRIGETLARRIVGERERGGPFVDLEDVQHRVHGVGPKTLERIRPYLSWAGELGGDNIIPDP